MPPGTVMSVAETAARLSAWMGKAALTAGDVSHELLERFVAAEAAGPVRHPSSARRIVAVRKYLIACGLLGQPAVPTLQGTPVTAELDAWGGWLAGRGIGVTTVADQRRWAGPFLTGLADGDGRSAGLRPAVMRRTGMSPHAGRVTRCPRGGIW